MTSAPMLRFVLQASLVLSLIAAPALAEEKVVADAPTPAQLYKRRCAVCHGPGGEGRTVLGEREGVADLSDREWQKAWSDTRIAAVIRDGSPANGKMPAFATKLTEADIQRLVAYIRSLSAPTPR